MRGDSRAPSIVRGRLGVGVGEYVVREIRRDKKKRKCGSRS